VYERPRRQPLANHGQLRSPARVSDFKETGQTPHSKLRNNRSIIADEAEQKRKLANRPTTVMEGGHCNSSILINNATFEYLQLNAARVNSNLLSLLSTSL